MELRTVADAELEPWLRSVMASFSEPFHAEAVDDERALLELDRTIGWWDVDGWIATGGNLSFSFAVPGGELPAAGVTAITVAPTYRRRGLLRGMMTWLLDDAREREEPLAILFAAEAPIYGRFGFGHAAPHRAYKLDRWFSAFRPDVPVPPGRVRALAAEPDSAPALVPIAERTRRPGMQRVDERMFRHAYLAPDPEEEGERRLVVYEDEGFALYRVEGGEDILRELPAGTLTLHQLVAATPAAEVALWRFLLDVDLMVHTVVPLRPPDDALPYLLADARRLETLVVDGLWLAVLDVPAALAGRRYAAEDRLVLAVDGQAFALEGSLDGAQCASTTASSDVALSGEALGALYLGGVPPAALAAAGRLAEHTPGATDRLARLFAWPVAPWCPFQF